MSVKEKKPIVKRAPKTVKEKKFVKAYLESGNGTQAVMEAGYKATYQSARVIASENLAKLNMDYWFEKAGLTNEVLAQAVTQKALTAKKRDHFSGEYEEDHSIQLASLKFAADLMGLTKKEDSGPVFNYFQYIQSQKNNFNGS